MRYAIKLLIFILSLNIVKAQNNLTLNVSFEQVIGCPNVNLGAINEGYVNNVSNPANYTPDYFNACYYSQGVPYLAVPSNVRGYQFAKTGNAYIGIGLWEKNSNAREYTQIKFSTALKANHHYAFQCYLSRAEFFRYAVSNFGAYFSIDSVSMPATDILPFVPQINNPAGNYFTDTLNWMPFTGSFIAQGGEQYVILGNFNSVVENIDTLYQYWGESSYQRAAYYFIDDVSLIDLDSTLTLKENEAMAQVEVFPNPAKELIVINHYGIYNALTIQEVNGKVVFQAVVSKNLSSETFDVSFLANGIYILNMLNASSSKRVKLIINK